MQIVPTGCPVYSGSSQILKYGGLLTEAFYQTRHDSMQHRCSDDEVTRLEAQFNPKQTGEVLNPTVGNTDMEMPSMCNQLQNTHNS